MTEEKHYPAFPLFRPTNRSQKRAMEQEYQRFSFKLAQVEANFAQVLFSDYGLMSYDDMYKTYLGLYIQTAEHIQKHYSPKYIVVNPEYFKEMYGVEFRQIKPWSLSHDLMELARQKLWFM